MNETHTWSDHCENILLEDGDDIYYFLSISSVDESDTLAFAGYYIGIIFFFSFRFKHIFKSSTFY